MNILKIRKLATEEVKKFEKEYNRKPTQEECTAIAQKIIAGSPKLSKEDKK